MQLLLIRHGAAVERGTPGIPDDERPLTPDGEKKFRRAAAGLARVAERPYALLSSPLPRAHRTAELAGEAWAALPVTATPALASGSFGDLDKTLSDYPHKATIALVGHEPYLSELLARLIGTKAAERLGFRKGGAALVDVPGKLAEGGSLVWFLPPRILRELAE